MPNRSHHKGPTKEEGFQFAAHSGKQSWQKKEEKKKHIAASTPWCPVLASTISTAMDVSLCGSTFLW
jgi:hypothetical protein